MKVKFERKLCEYVNWLEPYDEIVVEHGMKIHVMNHHPACAKYLKHIITILEYPDYVGFNPNVKGQSFELIKTLDDNILIGVKLDTTRNRLYAASLYTITNSKLEHRIKSGRLKKID